MALISTAKPTLRQRSMAPSLPLLTDAISAHSWPTRHPPCHGRSQVSNTTPTPTFCVQSPCQRSASKSATISAIPRPSQQPSRPFRVQASRAHPLLQLAAPSWPFKTAHLHQPRKRHPDSSKQRHLHMFCDLTS